MQIREGNEHLVARPEGVMIGDLVSHTTRSGIGGKQKTTETLATVRDILYYPDDMDNVPEDRIQRITLRPLDKKQADYTPLFTGITVISRPENILNVTDEELDDRIDRLHSLNYTAPVSKRKKAKSSTVTETGTKTKTSKAKIKEAVSTGKVTGGDLDELNALLERIRKGEL